MQKYSLKQLEQLLFKARYELLSSKETKFIGYLLLSLKTKFTNRVPIAGVDADLNLYINPERLCSVEKGNEERHLHELTGILCHEVLHVALEHFTRQGNRDHLTFNLAGDVIINEYIDNIKANNGKTKIILPENAYRNDKVPSGASTEQAYDIIKEERDQQKEQMKQKMKAENPEMTDDEIENAVNGEMEISIEDLIDILDSQDGSGSENSETYEQGGSGGTKIKVNMENATPEQLNKIRNAIINAEQSAIKDQSYGSVPDFVKRSLKNIREPIVDWRKILQRYMNSLAKREYKWDRPNRRHLAMGNYMPSIRGKELDRIALAIDTSGSITTKQLEQFAGDIKGIYAKYTPEEMRIIQFNTEITQDIKVKNTRDVDRMDFVGNGGTDVASTLREFKEDKSKCLIVITDGFFHIDHSMHPRKDVIWLIYDNDQCTMPFGRVVHINID